MTRVSPSSAERFARRERAGRVRRLRVPLILAGVVLLAVAVGWAVWFSSLADARSVPVGGLGSGDAGLTAAQVRQEARVPIGEPLARVDLAAVRDRVERLPGVRSAEVSRGWPHDVVIDVTERSAVVAWRDGSTVRLVDRSGVAFRTVPRVPERLGALVVPSDSGDRNRALLAAGARVAGTLPDRIADRVELIAVQSRDAIRLRLAGDVTVMWGSAAESGRKAEVLLALLPREKKMYDVSVPDFPTVQAADAA